jgi:hypothetical protein
MMNKNWFTRFFQTNLDDRYFDNMCEATRQFYDWFVGETKDDYVGMLTGMHQFATRGGYNGFTNTDGPMVPVFSCFRGIKKEAWRPMLKKKWFTNVNVNQRGLVKPCLKHIPLQGSHHLVDREAGYELHLPDTDRVVDYVCRMVTIMETLQVMFDSDLLAEYIQLFVVAHPFERVNYSICMAQANAILHHYGYVPILHGYFDFDCFIYDYDRIEKIFANMIEKRETVT